MNKDAFEFVIFAAVITIGLVTLARATAKTRRADREVMRRYAARLAPVQVNWLHDLPLFNRARAALGDDADYRDVVAVEKRMVEAINAALLGVSGEAFIDAEGRIVADPIGRENVREISRVSWDAMRRVLDDLGEEVIP